MTFEEIIKKLNSLGFDLVGKYVNTTTPVKIVDAEGYYYNIRWEGFGKTTPHKVDPRNPFSDTNIKTFVNKNFPNVKIIKSNHKTHRSKIFLEDKDGFKYEMSWDCLLVTKHLNIVSIYNKYNIYNMNLWLKIHELDLFVTDKKFVGAKEKTSLIDSFGYKYSIFWDNLKKTKKIPIASPANKYSIKNIILWLKLNNILLKLQSKKYDISSKHLVFKCLVCEMEFDATWNNIHALKGCPFCAVKRHESKVATGLKKYCKEKYDAIPEYKIIKNIKTGRWLPYDIFIPNIRLFVEISGVQHYYFHKKWHGDIETFNEFVERDLLKKNFAKKNGMFLEIDLRKIKTIDAAINKLNKFIEGSRI